MQQKTISDFYFKPKWNVTVVNQIKQIIIINNRILINTF